MDGLLNKHHQVTICFPKDMPREITVDMDDDLDYYSEDALDDIAHDYIWETLIDYFGMNYHIK